MQDYKIKINIATYLLDISIYHLADILIKNNHHFEHQELVRRLILEPMNISELDQDNILKLLYEKLLEEVTYIQDVNNALKNEYKDKLYHLLLLSNFHTQDRVIQIQTMQSLNIPQYKMADILKDFSIKGK